jgi:transcription initiation factor IIE alpha subunit
MQIYKDPLMKSIYDVLPDNLNGALTIREIGSRLPEICPNSIRQPLYVLRDMGFVLYRMRIDVQDDRKNACEYWKAGDADIDQFIEPTRQMLNYHDLLCQLPVIEDEAVSVRCLSEKLHIPQTSVRCALEIMEKKGLVHHFQGTNWKNQTTSFWFRDLGAK